MSTAPSPYPIAPVTPGEAETFVRTTMRVFGHTLTDESIAHLVALELADPSLSLAVRDRGRIIGTATVLEFELTVPGAPPVPCAGITSVAVLPTHRRRGVLTSLMRRQLDDLRAQGWAWAALYASEDVIYGRFGFGQATQHLRGRIDRPWAALRGRVDAGGVELLTPDEALRRVPPIYEAVARAVPGMLSVSDALWHDQLAWDPPGERRGASERYIVAVDDRAYATYRIAEAWNDAGSDSTLRVEAHQAVDADAGRRLWAYLLGVDLVQHVRIGRLPLDHPLPRWLAERRRLRLQLAESLYLRLVDVGAALSRRGTTATTGVVLDVTDPFCPWNTRRWVLEGDGARLRCAPTDDRPDVSLDVSELASLSVGGVAADELARAGLADEHTPGALGRVTALLASPRTPYNAFTF